MTGLMTERQRMAVEQVVEEYEARTAVAARTTINSVRNGNAQNLGIPLSGEGRMSLADYVSAYLNPFYWSGWVGWYVNLVLGATTICLLAWKIGCFFYQFGKGMKERGWDGGRTLWRALASVMGFVYLPYDLFKSVVTLQSWRDKVEEEAENLRANRKAKGYDSDVEAGF